MSNKTFRIEKRSNGPTLYWDARGNTWDEWPDMATVYSEADREAYLQREVRGEPNKFPRDGVWVVLEADRTAA